MIVEMKPLHLEFFGDFQLVINQLLESYEVKKPELSPYHDYDKTFIGYLGDVNLYRVPRTENKKFDGLGTLASTLTLPDQTQVTSYQKQMKPLPNKEEHTENELKYLICVS